LFILRLFKDAVSISETDDERIVNEHREKGKALGLLLIGCLLSWPFPGKP
jgi:hypothetical protein